MAKIKYYSDTETCDFEKADVDSHTILRTVLSYLMVSGVVAISVVVYLFYFSSNPLTDSSGKTTGTYPLQLEKFDEAIASLETDLEALHQKDETILPCHLESRPHQGQMGEQVRAVRRSSNPLKRNRCRKPTCAWMP